MKDRDQVLAYVLGIVEKKPGITLAQICRAINERGQSYCGLKSCYANQRQRNKWGKRINVCKWNLQSLIYYIKKYLEPEEKLVIIWGKYTDNYQPRGWDFMNGCYLPKDAPTRLENQSLFHFNGGKED